MRRFVLCFALFAVISPPAWSAHEIKPFVSGSYQQIISARKGKPFIISLWSLNCGYCKVELGMLKKLSRKYPGLDLVLISTDTPEEQKMVSAALKKLSLDKTEAWLFADNYAERLRHEIDSNWYGELPRTYFFNANNEVKAVSGQIEQAEVERWIGEQYISKRRQVNAE